MYHKHIFGHSIFNVYIKNKMIFFLVKVIRGILKIVDLCFVVILPVPVVCCQALIYSFFFLSLD